jgi:hypothetical protein
MSGAAQAVVALLIGHQDQYVRALTLNGQSVGMFIHLC